MIYTLGYDVIYLAPGAPEPACPTCGGVMAAARVTGPTCFAEAMAGRRRPHDRWACAAAAADWHRDLIALLQEAGRLASPTLRAIVHRDAVAILKAEGLAPRHGPGTVWEGYAGEGIADGAVAFQWPGAIGRAAGDPAAGGGA